VAEGLAGIVRKAAEKELLESLKIKDRFIKVNMLQYTYDMLFFCKVKVKSKFVIKTILNCFELASGSKVNF